MKKLNEMEIFEVNPITNNQNKDYQLSIFLAGTIDMGSSRDWQQEFIQQLIKASQNVKEQTGSIAVFNPRRPPEYGPSNPNFDLREQIRWELEHLEKANTIIMYIIGSSKSPVSNPLCLNSSSASWEAGVPLSLIIETVSGLRVL